MALLDYGYMFSKNGQYMINGNMLGDYNFYIDIYKNDLCIYNKGVLIDTISFDYTHKKCIVNYVNICNVRLKIKKIKYGQFLVTFTYNGNHYRCVYGYGVGRDVIEWWEMMFGCSKTERKMAMINLKFLKLKDEKCL